MKRLILLPALLVILAACSTTKPAHENKGAQYFFQQGEKYYDQGLYKKAVESWEKVRDRFYSPELTALAEMKIADAHYAAGEYVEAAAGFEDFLKQHPSNELTSQVLFKLGMSYYKQILSPDRDQTATRNALATFESLLKIYPGSAKKAEVRGLIRQCKKRLAAHEFYVGNYYLRAGHYQAAIARLKGLLATYPDYPEQDRTYCDMVQAYAREGNHPAAEKAFRTLSQKYPNSQCLSKALRSLKGTDSWWQELTSW